MSSELLKSHKCSLPAFFDEWLVAVSIWVSFQLSGGRTAPAVTLLSFLTHIVRVFFPYWVMLGIQI